MDSKVAMPVVIQKLFQLLRCSDPAARAGVTYKSRVIYDNSFTGKELSALKNKCKLLESSFIMFAAHSRPPMHYSNSSVKLWEASYQEKRGTQLWGSLMFYS